jgi:hypothetical protein
MKILFGVPDHMHRELADLEIEGIKNIIPYCNTIHYGPLHSRNRFIDKIILTVKNSIRIRKALKNGAYNLLFLNTAFDRNALFRVLSRCFSSGH